MFICSTWDHTKELQGKYQFHHACCIIIHSACNVNTRDEGDCIEKSTVENGVPKVHFEEESLSQ